MRGKHGNYQYPRSNNVGFSLRKKESRQHLLSPNVVSPPGSPSESFFGSFAPLDLGNIDSVTDTFKSNESSFTEEGREFNFEESSSSNLVTMMTGVSLSASPPAQITSVVPKRGGSVVSGNSSVNGKKSILSSKTLAKLKSQRRSQAGNDSTDTKTDLFAHPSIETTHTYPIPNKSHHYEIIDSNSFETFGDFSSPLNHTPKNKLHSKKSLNISDNDESGFVAVPSADGIETPVSKGAFGVKAAATAAATKQQQWKESLSGSLKNHDYSLSSVSDTVKDSATKKTGAVLNTPAHYKRDAIHSRFTIQSSSNKGDEKNISTSTSVQPPSSTKRSRSRGKVFQLAKMFSSKAIVPSEEIDTHDTSLTKLDSNVNSKSPTQVKSNEPNTPNRKKILFPPTPPSPASSASAPYMAWPGTQDGQGRTVSMPQDDDTNSRTTGISIENQHPDSVQGDDEWMDNENNSLEDDDKTEDENDDGGVEDVERPADRYLAAAVKEAAARTPLKMDTNLLLPAQRYTSNSHSSLHDQNSNLEDNNNKPSFSRRAVSYGHIRKINSSSRSNEGETINIQNLFQTPSNTDKKKKSPNQKEISSMSKRERWDIHSSITESSPITNQNLPKNLSSSFTNSLSHRNNTVRKEKPQTPIREGASVPSGIDLSGSKLRLKYSGREISQWKSPDDESSVTFSRKSKKSLESYPIIQPLSEAALAAQDKLSPLPRPLNGTRIKGYRGFFDKTSDLPNLMDDESSIATTSYVAERSSNSYLNTTKTSSGNHVGQAVDAESDVFDGLTTISTRGKKYSDPNAKSTKLKTIDAESDSDIFDGISNSGSYSRNSNNLKGASMAHIQQESTFSFRRKQIAISPKSGGSSLLKTSAQESKYEDQPANYYPDLSKYIIQARAVKKLVRKYKKLCDSFIAASAFENEIELEDTRKAFALFEMRSRIMESDIERGLQRRGGTVHVDDLVLTPSSLATLRIRDIVIVCKAWREGASPRDVITAAMLTRRSSHTYCIKRRVQNHIQLYPREISTKDSYYLEEVMWLDDMDFSLMRCPSMGPKHMRGFEMFTRGDCQSMLLKLTNERCEQLRQELDDATVKQINAERRMSEKNSFSQSSLVKMQAKKALTSAMEMVKIKSKQLVVAERSYELVKSRIEMLVAKYQTILMEMENSSRKDNETDSSSDNSHSIDEYDTESFCDDSDFITSENEKDILTRRAQEAELKAQVAAKEALIAKEEAERIRVEKQLELSELKKRLLELETKSIQDREEFERRLDFERQSSALYSSFSSSRDSQTLSKQRSSNSIKNISNLDSKERVKAKFRNRYAERSRQVPANQKNESPIESKSNSSGQFSKSFLSKYNKDFDIKQENHAYQVNEEEMFQHVEFYERSLKATEGKGTKR